MLALSRTAAVALCVLAIASSVAEARLRTSVSTKYYNVEARTAAELRAEISRRGPSYGSGMRRFTGWTQSNVRWRFHHATRAGKCRITKVSVKLRLTYTYPRWTNKRSASATLRRTWNAMMGGLRAHENQHGRIATDGARRISAALQRMSPRASCAALEAAANAQARRIWQRARQRDRALDRRTNHGATQMSRFHD